MRKGAEKLISGDKLIAFYKSSVTAEIISTYKAEGRRREIESALKALTWEARENTMPEDLCFLYGEYLDDYIHDVKICQEFARRNREKIKDA